MQSLHRSIIAVSLGALVLFLPLGASAQSGFTRLTPLTQEQALKVQQKEKAATLLVAKIAGGVAAVVVVICTFLFLGLFRAPKRFSRDSAFARGWELVRKYKWLLMGLFLAQETAMLLFQFAADELSRLLVRWKYAAVFAWTLLGVQRVLTVLLGAITLLFILKILLAIEDKNFKGMREWVRYLPSPKVFLAYISAMILSWLAILGGALLLVIPGIIAFVALQFYGLLLLDGVARGPLEALKKSAEITRGCRFDLFLLLFLLGALNVAGFMVFLVGLLVTIPLSLLVLVDVYRQLAGAPISTPQSIKPKR